MALAFEVFLAENVFPMLRYCTDLITCHAGDVTAGGPHAMWALLPPQYAGPLYTVNLGHVLEKQAGEIEQQRALDRESACSLQQDSSLLKGNSKIQICFNQIQSRERRK